LKESINGVNPLAKAWTNTFDAGINSTKPRYKKEIPMRILGARLFFSFLG
jgi:hypothetical protein